MLKTKNETCMVKEDFGEFEDQGINIVSLVMFVLVRYKTKIRRYFIANIPGDQEIT